MYVYIIVAIHGHPHRQTKLLKTSLPPASSCFSAVPSLRVWNPPKPKTKIKHANIHGDAKTALVFGVWEVLVALRNKTIYTITAKTKSTKIPKKTKQLRHSLWFFVWHIAVRAAVLKMRYAMRVCLPFLLLRLVV